MYNDFIKAEEIAKSSEVPSAIIRCGLMYSGESSFMKKLAKYLYQDIPC